MSILSIVLSIGWPGAAVAGTGLNPARSEADLVLSLAILGLLYRWIAGAKRQQAARLREKIVDFSQHASRLAGKPRRFFQA
jgi:hypothetical protein